MTPPVIVSKLLDPRMYPIRDPDFQAAQRPMEPTPEKITQLLRVLKFVQVASPSSTSLSSSNRSSDPSRLESCQPQNESRAGAWTILTAGYSAKKPLVDSPSFSSSPSVISPSITTAFPTVNTDNKLMIRFVQELFQQPYRDNSQEELGRGLSGFHFDGDNNIDIIVDPFKVSDESLGIQRNRRIQFNNDRDLLSRQFILSTADPYSLSAKSLRKNKDGGAEDSVSDQDEGQRGQQQEDLEQEDDEEPTKFLLTVFPEQCPFQHPATVTAGGKRDVLKVMVQHAMENEIGAMQWIQQNCSRALCPKIIGFAHHGQSRSRTQILEGFGLLGCILVGFPKEGILYQGPSRECRLTEQAHKHFIKQVAKMLFEMRRTTKNQVSGFTIPAAEAKEASYGRRISLKTQLQQMMTYDAASGDPALKPLDIRSRFDLVVDALRATDMVTVAPSTSSNLFPPQPSFPSSSRLSDQRPTSTGILRRKGRQLLSRGGRPLPYINIDDPEAQHPLHRLKQSPNSPLRYMIRASDLERVQNTLSKDSIIGEGHHQGDATSPLSQAGGITGSCSITLSKRSSATPSSTSVSSAFDGDMTVYCSRRGQKNSFTGSGRIRETMYTPPPPASRHILSQPQSSRRRTLSGKVTSWSSTVPPKESSSALAATTRSESQRSRKSVIDLFNVGAWKKSPQGTSPIVGKGKEKAAEERLPVGQPAEDLGYDGNDSGSELNGIPSSRHAEPFQWSVENSLTWPMEFITTKNRSNNPDSAADTVYSASMYEQIRLWNTLVALERLDSAPGSNSRFPRALFELLPRILALVHDELLFVNSVVLPRRRTVIIQGMEEVLNNDPAFRPQDIFEGVECVLSHGASMEPVSWIVASRQHHRRNGTVLAILNWSHAGFLPDYEENVQAPFVETAPSTFWRTSGDRHAPAPIAVQLQTKPERNKLSSIAKRLSGSLRRSSSALFRSKLSFQTYDGEANRTGSDNGSSDIGEDGPPSSDSSLSTASVEYSTKYPAPWPVVNHAFALDLTVPAKFMTFQQQDPSTRTASACSCPDSASSLPLSSNSNTEAKISGLHSLRSKLKLGKGSKVRVATQKNCSLTPPSSILSVDTTDTKATFYISSSSTLSLPYLQRPNLLQRNEDREPFGTGSVCDGPPLRRGDLVPVSRRVHARSWSQFQQSFQRESRKASEMASLISDNMGASTITTIATKAPSTAAATLASSVSAASKETLCPSLSSPSASSSRRDLGAMLSQEGPSSPVISTTDTVTTSGGNDGSNTSDDENGDDAWMLRELESLDQFGESFIYDFEAPSSSSFSPAPTTLSDDHPPTAPSAPTISSGNSSSDYDNDNGTDLTPDPFSPATATAAVLRALVSVSKTLQNMVVLLESGATILTPAQLSEAIAARQEIAWDREEQRLLQIERAEQNFKKLHREAAQRQAMEQGASMKSRQTPITAATTASSSPRLVERPTLNHSLYTAPRRSSIEETFGTASESSTGPKRRPSTASRKSRTSTKNSKKKSSPASRSFKSVFQTWRMSRKASIKNKKRDDRSPFSTWSSSGSTSSLPLPSSSVSGLADNDKSKAPSSRSYIPVRSPEDDILYSAPGLQRDPLPSELPAHLFNLTASTNKQSSTTCRHHGGPSTGRTLPLSPSSSITPLPPANCPVFGIRFTAEDERERERLEREEQAFWKGLEGHWDQSLGSRTWEQQQAIRTTSGSPDQPSSSSSLGNRRKVTNRVGGNGGGGIALLDLKQLEQCLNIVEQHVQKVEGQVASAFYVHLNKL